MATRGDDAVVTVVNDIDLRVERPIEGSRCIAAPKLYAEASRNRKCSESTAGAGNGTSVQCSERWSAQLRASEPEVARGVLPQVRVAVTASQLLADPSVYVTRELGRYLGPGFDYQLRTAGAAEAANAGGAYFALDTKSATTLAQVPVSDDALLTLTAWPIGGLFGLAGEQARARVAPRSLNKAAPWALASLSSSLLAPPNAILALRLAPGMCPAREWTEELDVESNGDDEDEGRGEGLGGAADEDETEDETSPSLALAQFWSLLESSVVIEHDSALGAGTAPADALAVVLPTRLNQQNLDKSRGEVRSIDAETGRFSTLSRLTPTGKATITISLVLAGLGGLLIVLVIVVLLRAAEYAFVDHCAKQRLLEHQLAERQKNERADNIRAERAAVLGYALQRTHERVAKRQGVGSRFQQIKLECGLLGVTSTSIRNGLPPGTSVTEAYEKQYTLFSVYDAIEVAAMLADRAYGVDSLRAFLETLPTKNEIRRERDTQAKKKKERKEEGWHMAQRYLRHIEQEATGLAQNLQHAALEAVGAESGTEEESSDDEESDAMKSSDFNSVYLSFCVAHGLKPVDLTTAHSNALLRKYSLQQRTRSDASTSVVKNVRWRTAHERANAPPQPAPPGGWAASAVKGKNLTARAFLAERCVASAFETDMVDVEDLEEEYKKWCDARGVHGMARGRITTSPELVHFHGVLVENMPVRYVHGVRPIKVKEARVLSKVPKAKKAADRAYHRAEKAAMRALRAKLPKNPVKNLCGDKLTEFENDIEEELKKIKLKANKIGQQAADAAIRAAEEGCLFQRELFPFRSGLLRTRVDKKAKKQPNPLKRLTNVKKHIIGLAQSLRAPGNPLREFTFTTLSIVIGPIVIAIPVLLLIAWIEYCVSDAFALNGSPGPLTSSDGWKRRALPPAVAPLYALVGEGAYSFRRRICVGILFAWYLLGVFEALSSYITRLTVSALRASLRACHRTECACCGAGAGGESAGGPQYESFAGLCGLAQEDILAESASRHTRCHHCAHRRCVLLVRCSHGHVVGARRDPEPEQIPADGRGSCHIGHVHRQPVQTAEQIVRRRG